MLSFGLSSLVFAACVRDLPSIDDEDNFMGGENASTGAPLSRTATDMVYAGANWILFGDGRPYQHDLLHPYGFFSVFMPADVESSGESHTAICNELGQCGAMTISAEWVGIPLEVPLENDTLGDDMYGFHLTFLVGQDVTDITVKVNFGGQTVSKDFDAAYEESEYRAWQNENGTDPNYLIPSTLEPYEGDDDFRCRDNDGEVTSGNANSSGGSDDDDDEDESVLNDWLEWEDSHWDCRDDFSDPNGSGSICWARS